MKSLLSTIGFTIVMIPFGMLACATISTIIFEEVTGIKILDDTPIPDEELEADIMGNDPITVEKPKPVESSENFEITEADFPGKLEQYPAFMVKLFHEYSIMNVAYEKVSSPEPFMIKEMRRTRKEALAMFNDVALKLNLP